MSMQDYDEPLLTVCTYKDGKSKRLGLYLQCRPTCTYPPPSRILERLVEIPYVSDQNTVNEYDKM